MKIWDSVYVSYYLTWIPDIKILRSKESAIQMPVIRIPPSFGLEHFLAYVPLPEFLTPFWTALIPSWTIWGFLCTNWVPDCTRLATWFWSTPLRSMALVSTLKVEPAVRTKLFSSLRFVFLKLQDRFTTSFTTCGPGPLIFGVGSRCKVLWCQSCADIQTKRQTKRQTGLVVPLAFLENHFVGFWQ